MSKRDKFNFIQNGKQKIDIAQKEMYTERVKRIKIKMNLFL